MKLSYKLFISILLTMLYNNIECSNRPDAKRPCYRDEQTMLSSNTSTKKRAREEDAQEESQYIPSLRNQNMIDMRHKLASIDSEIEACTTYHTILQNSIPHKTQKLALSQQRLVAYQYLRDVIATGENLEAERAILQCIQQLNITEKSLL